MEVKVGVYKKGSYVFKQNGQTGEVFYIVKKGAVDILDEKLGDTRLVDRCGEGDMFGIRPMLADTPYLFHALSREDAILYEIPMEGFKETYHRYDKALDYMIQRFAAGRSIRDNHDSRIDHNSPLVLSSLVIKPSIQRSLVRAGENTQIGDAVATMSQEGVSSIIISNKEGHPIGIITDRDVRNFVAKGYDPTVPVTKIMSSPVSCVSTDLSLQEIQLVMIETGYHHLCLTEDGSNQSKGIGMITEHDILYAGATDPVVILKKIKSAGSLEDLKESRNKIDLIVPNFLDESIDRRLSLSLIDRLNRALLQKTIQLALDEYNASHEPIPADSFSFFNMGSMARGEQLLMTDQDNGMIIHNDYVERREEYLLLAQSITSLLHQIGFEYCPANMMASNPDWCISLDELKNKVSRWMLNPGPEEVMMTEIFFDFRHEFGDPSLGAAIKSHIQQLLSEQDLYLRFLAKQAIKNPPPLSFFRRFIIEKDGEHKDHFDIKLRAISPLQNSARVLAFEYGYLQSTNSFDRYRAIAKADPGNALLYEEAEESLVNLLAFRLKFALQNQNSGRYIKPDQLSKVDRIHLRNSFVPARRLIDMLERMYRLGFM